MVNDTGVERQVAGSDRWRALTPTLLAGLVAVLLAAAFIQLGSEMNEGETRAFDKSILHAMQALRVRYPWVAPVMRDLTGLGSTVVLTLCTLVAVGYLALVAARRRAWMVAIAVSLGAAGVSLLKANFERGRPSPAFAELMAPGMSFPSGHAGMSAIVFLTVGALLASHRRRAAERVYIFSVAALLTLLVGLSRMALGVHWATDVLAGWTYGFAWALFWLLLVRWLEDGRGAARDRDEVAPP
jgi:undecaprenyl-diphosphatase